MSKPEFDQRWQAYLNTIRDAMNLQAYFESHGGEANPAVKLVADHLDHTVELMVYDLTRIIAPTMPLPGKR